MGQIQPLKDKTVIRFSVEEVLTIRVATLKNVTFTLAEMIRKFAEMKVFEKAVALPNEPTSTTFDPEKLEFVVSFSQTVERAT
jgi:hypothetical protein